MQAGRKLEDGGHWGCEPTGGQAQARPPQEGTLGSRLKWDSRGTQLQSGASPPTPSLGQGVAATNIPQLKQTPGGQDRRVTHASVPTKTLSTKKPHKGRHLCPGFLVPYPEPRRPTPSVEARGCPGAAVACSPVGPSHHAHSQPGSPAVPPVSSCPPAAGPSVDSGKPRPPAACLSPQAAQGPAAPRTDAQWPLWGQQCRCGSSQHAVLSHTQEERGWRGPTLQHVLELPQCRLLGGLHTRVAWGAREASLGEAGENEAPEGALTATLTWARILGLTNFLSWPRHRFFEGP